jgi:hypothetical protein
VLHTSNEYRTGAAVAIAPTIVGVDALRPGARADVKPHAERSEAIADTAARAVASDVLDVSRPSSGERTFLQNLVSLAGAAGIALLVPFAILLVGLPVVLAVRGALQVIEWMLGIALR